MKSYKRTHAADAANLFIRNLLCEISEQLGGFTDKDWESTCEYFEGKCAYTGVFLKGANMVQDHLIAHNKKKGGLHLYGNIVPASKEANASKGGKSVEEFFQSDALCLREMSKEERQERMEKICAFQRESGYFDKCALLKCDITGFLQKSYEDVLMLVDTKMREFEELVEVTEVGRELVRENHRSKANRIFKWAKSPNQISHKIVAVYLRYAPMTTGDLVDRLTRIGIAKDPYNSVHNMMTDKGHSYGKVFMEEDGYLVFIPELREPIEEIKDRFQL